MVSFNAFLASPSSLGLRLTCIILLLVPNEIESDEVGVDSQSLHVHSATNGSSETNLNQTNSVLAGPSNKFSSLDTFPVGAQGPRSLGPPTNVPQHKLPYHYHVANSHNHHQQQIPYYYQPRIQLDPIQIDNLANASKQIVGELVSVMSQAFHNLFSQSRSRSAGNQVALLNGENIIATASRLLPSATKLLSRNALSTPRLSDPYIAFEKAESNETSKQSKVDDLASPNGIDAINYELEGQKLRQDIVQKVGHLQTVLTTAIEVSKERRDIISRRILEQTNYRLELAKERADRILSEPLNSQLAVRTLYTINQGINGIHSFLHGLLDRINISINVKLANPANKTQDKLNETPKSANSETDKAETSKVSEANNSKTNEKY